MATKLVLARGAVFIFLLGISISGLFPLPFSKMNNSLVSCSSPDATCFSCKERMVDWLWVISRRSFMNEWNIVSSLRIYEKSRWDSGKRVTSYPFVSGDTFRSLSTYLWDETGHNNDWRGEDVTLGDIVFVKTDMLGDFFKNRFPSINAAFILLSHNADHSMPGMFVDFLDDDRIIKWYGQNKAIDHPRLSSLPIGIANGMWSHGNVTVFTQKLQSMVRERVDRDILLYINFDLHTNNQRGEWIDTVKRNFISIPGISLDEIKISHGSYLEKLGRSKFVLSPPGNGVDCHRTWEAILMGAIPIVLSSGINDLYVGSPVLVIGSFQEVTEQLLLNFQVPDTGRQIAFAETWISKITNTQQSARRAAFIKTRAQYAK